MCMWLAATSMVMMVVVVKRRPTIWMPISARFSLFTPSTITYLSLKYSNHYLRINFVVILAKLCARSGRLRFLNEMQRLKCHSNVSPYWPPPWLNCVACKRYMSNEDWREKEEEEAELEKEFEEENCPTFFSTCIAFGINLIIRFCVRIVVAGIYWKSIDSFAALFIVDDKRIVHPIMPPKAKFAEGKCELLRFAFQIRLFCFCD